MNVREALVSRLHRRAGDESGSIVIAMLAVIVASGLMVAVSTYAFQGHRMVSFDRDHVRAVQGADAAVHEVLYRLVLPNGDPNKITSNLAMPATWTALGDSQYRYSVTSLGNAQWRVEAEGRLNGRVRRVRANLGQNRPFVTAAFADDHLTLRGANSANSYSSVSWGTGEGRVGSNGTVTLNGNATVDGVDLHDYEANSTNRCSNPSGTYCSTATTHGPEKDLSSDGALGFVTDGVNSTAPCPGSPTVWRASAGPLLAGGTYCFSRVNFDTNVNFTGTSTNPTIIYLTGEPGQPTVAVSNKVRVNCPDCSGTGGPRPEASRLQIFTAAPQDVRIGNNTHFAGIIYAPRATCKGNPSNAQAQFYGSLVCSVITNQGGWGFHFDQRLSEVGAGGYDIIRWSEY
ncbi:MAG TPA: hypothetical protein VM307_04620 [Egibacteraceae bacterium]|nr:hypothetical protein [Egibacteraceae bacterium]